MFIIHCGSGAEYDKRQDLVKVEECDFNKNVPIDLYGYSKYIISNLANKSNNILNLRIFGLYGKYEDYKYKFISNAIIKNLFRLPIIINQNVYFDYLNIDDFVNIVDYFIWNKPLISSINVTPNLSIDLVSVAKIINEIGDFESEIIVLNGGLNKEYTGSNTLLLHNIGNYCFKSYYEGIKDLYNYYKKILNKIDYNEIVKNDYLNRVKKI